MYSQYILCIRDEDHQEDIGDLSDSIEGLKSHYRDEFSLHVITDWTNYEFFYSKSVNGMSLELRAMMDDSHPLVVGEF